MSTGSRTRSGFDSEVLLALRAGTTSFADAMRHHDGTLRSLARKLLRVNAYNSHSAEKEDAYQICALRMWRAVDEWAPSRGPIGAYVYGYVWRYARHDFKYQETDTALAPCRGGGADAERVGVVGGWRDAHHGGGLRAGSPEKLLAAKQAVSVLRQLPGTPGELARHMLGEGGGLQYCEAKYKSFGPQDGRNRGKRGAFHEVLRAAEAVAV